MQAEYGKVRKRRRFGAPCMNGAVPREGRESRSGAAIFIDGGKLKKIGRKILVRKVLIFPRLT